MTRQWKTPRKGDVEIGSEEHTELMHSLDERVNDFSRVDRKIDFVTNRIAVGTHPVVVNRVLSQLNLGGGSFQEELVNQGITHLLYVGDSPYENYGWLNDFQGHASVPVVDETAIPRSDAENVLFELHRMVHSPDAKLYMHCTAGQNRSPNLLLLYFVALGMKKETGIKLIKNARSCADAGSKVMLPPDSGIYEHAELLGREYIRSFNREILDLPSELYG